METIKVEEAKIQVELLSDWTAYQDETVTISGMVLRIRKLSWGAFIALNLPRYCIQCVCSNEALPEKLIEGDFVEVTGTVKRAKINDKTIWPNNYEVGVEKVTIIQKAKDVSPIDLSKKLREVLDRNLNENE